jgi:hypothetical protein
MSPILEVSTSRNHVTDQLEKSEQIIRGLAAVIIGDHGGFRSVWEITNETCDRWAAATTSDAAVEGNQLIQHVA